MVHESLYIPIDEPDAAALEAIEAEATEHNEATIALAGQVKAIRQETKLRRPKREPYHATEYSDNITTRYLNEIGLVPLLTKQEEIELSKLIHSGHRAAAKLATADLTINALNKVDLRREVESGLVAKEHMFRANLRLVVSIARRYPMPPGMEILDLIQEGNLGLEHAVEKFDWRKGFKLSTYATFWIRQAIGRALDSKSNLIAVPGNVGTALRAQIRHIDDVNDLEPYYARINKLLKPVSLDAPVRSKDQDEATELVDLLEDETDGVETTAMLSADAGDIQNLLDTLNDRQRRIASLRFGFIDGRKRTFREIGDEFGITSEAVRRQFNKAVEKLIATNLELELVSR